MYKDDYTIQGIDDWGQFPPLLNKHNTKSFQVFDTHYIRTLDLVRMDYKPKFRGIETYRFQISNDSWAVNDDMYEFSVAQCPVSQVSCVWYSLPTW